MSKDNSPRPVRDVVEKGTSKIPKGPAGFAGDGDLVGLAGVFITELSGALVPGSEFDPGFEVKGEEITRSSGTQRHKFTIDAYSKDIAEAVAKVRAPPSNIDLATKNVQVVSSKAIQKRPTASTWSIIVNIEDRDI